jgi:DNA-binding XRE family transcriptional regulator
MLRGVAAPTRAKRRLGRFLADLREREEVFPQDAARELKTSKSTLLRYEGGDVMPVWSTVQSLLRFYNASAEQHRQAEDLWQEAHDEPPPVRVPAGTPTSFRKLVTRERDAETIRAIEPLLVPGLLQTESYARALMTAGRRLFDVPSRADSVVSTRLIRQKRLEGRDPIHLHAVLDQAVITREIGGADVMREQLAYLLELGARTTITIQVVPFAAGAYGPMNGACTIVGYSEADEPPNVYLEYPAGGAWVEDLADVRKFVAVFDDVTELALSPDDTAKLLRKHKEELAQR